MFVSLARRAPRGPRAPWPFVVDALRLQAVDVPPPVPDTVPTPPPVPDLDDPTVPPEVGDPPGPPGEPVPIGDPQPPASHRTVPAA